LPRLEKGFDVDRIWELTRIDRWFLYKLQNISNIKKQLEKYDSMESLPDRELLHAKINGFSDFQIARHVLKSDNRAINEAMLTVRRHRKAVELYPMSSRLIHWQPSIPPSPTISISLTAGWSTTYGMKMTSAP
jgi:carbamoyl-phosphate synthase large subunit